MPRDRIRWAAIVAGLLSALVTFITLSILGAAIGATTLGGGTGLSPNATHYTVFAGIWGAASAIIAFFIGGFIAAKTAAAGGGANGWLNGVMVFVAGFVLILWLVFQGAGNLFGVVGNNLNDLRNIAINQFNTPEARSAAVDNATSGLWWTFVSIIVGLIAAGLGGLVGQRPVQAVRRTDESVTG